MSSAPPKQNQREWLLVAAALALAIPVWLWRGNAPGPGSTLNVKLTLVTSDREDLACGLAEQPGGYSCQFLPNGTRTSPAPTDEFKLAPYMTSQRQLYLIPHLFGQDALQRRYDEEPPTRVARRQLKRFTARCRLTLVSKVSGISVRWLRRSKLEGDSTAWVARADQCRVDP